MRRHSKSLISLINEVAPNPRFGAEIGVYRGENAQRVLEEFPQCELVLVDTWCEWSGDSTYYKHHGNMGHKTSDSWEATMVEAMERTSYFRVVVRRMTSKEASIIQQDGSLDFCFIDSNHTYESVREDIELWLPKVRKGGLISGHDYGGRYRGVSEAVDERFGLFPVIKKAGRIWGVGV